MSLTTNQTALNPTNDFFLKSQGSNIIPQNTPIYFNETPDGSYRGALFGGLSSMWIQSTADVKFSQLGSGNVKVEMNLDATQGNSLPGLYVSSPILCDTAVVSQGVAANTAVLSNINGIPQKPTATSFGYFNFPAGQGSQVVPDSNIQASTIILCQQFGGYGLGDGTSFSTNPVPGVGFVALANKVLTSTLSMVYYIPKW